MTVVVPFGAGGNTDTMARLVTQRLQERLGQPFLVDNRGGAGGAIAMGQIARAPADGYTIAFAASPQIEIVPLLRQVNYDPVKDLVPISVFGAGPFVLGINKSIPGAEFGVHRLRQAATPRSTMARAARARWRILRVRCSANVPASSHPRSLQGRRPGRGRLHLRADRNVLRQCLRAVQANATGKVTIIAVSSEQPMPQFPGVPTISETMPDFVLTSGTASWGRRGCRRHRRSAREGGCRDCTRAAVQKRLIEFGIKPIGNTPAEFAATIQKEMPFFSAAAKAAGLTQ